MKILLIYAHERHNFNVIQEWKICSKFATSESKIGGIWVLLLTKILTFRYTWMFFRYLFVENFRVGHKIG